MRVEIFLDKTDYVPGELVTGKVVWDTQNTKPPKHVLVSLLWHTEGKGDEDMAIIDQKKLLEQSPQGSTTFELQLPDFPYSYDGSLLSIVWIVEAGLGKGKVAQKTIQSHPDNDKEVQFDYS